MTSMFNVPDHALPAWEELHSRILATGPTPCSGPDRDDWTGTTAQQARAAARCLDCAAMQACGQYALTAREDSGTWGGMSPAERKGKTA